MKKCLLLCLALVLSSVFALSCFASTSDFDYEGELDIRTGEPKNGDENGSGDLVAIGGGAFYNVKEKVYVYTCAGAEVKLNMPAGAVSTSPFSVSFPAGLNVFLYKDGVPVEKPDFSKISEEGNYVLRFGDDSGDSLQFTVVGKLTCIVNGFQVPTGFRVISASIDDEPIETLSYVDMSRDGKYKIQYRCTQINTTYTLTTTVDHTAPSLRLNAVKDGYASGPVSIADLEEGVKASITLNGSPIKYQEKLTKSGLYKIVLRDEAGNTRSYSFVIRVYFNFNSYVFFAIVLLIAAGIVFYLYKVKKNLRVR